MSSASSSGPQPRPSPSGWRLGAMRIRKKLIFLHTIFSIALAAVLILALRPAIVSVVTSAEEHACRVALGMLAATPEAADRGELEGVDLAVGSPADVGVVEALASVVRANPGRPIRIDSDSPWPRMAMWDAQRGVMLVATARSDEARRQVLNLYALVVIALLVVYFLIALALEVFVLPRNVWRPIARLREADAAVQAGSRDEELIPESEMPRDELGEIMRSRNESIIKLREHEAALANALDRLETVATDLKRKNHLLESVQRNMADQDRLVSLGMMSAGLAHELNTPLAVLKGEVERIVEGSGAPVDDSRAALMLRTIHRLERLSESLLDFARVRPHSTEPVDLRSVASEAWTLVKLDREAEGVRMDDRIPEGCVVRGDPDRLTQVFVNILRNAVDAMGCEGTVALTASRDRREGAEWVSVLCADSGPGIDPEILPRLFEPFTTTRLDARGTGLGLAVAEGIVREHGGVILARNAASGGAVFEIMLPVDPAMVAKGEPTRE